MATTLPKTKQVDLTGLGLKVTDVDVAGTIEVTKFNLDSTTATLSSHAATISKYAARITTESLTTAHTASQALVITLSGVAAGDLAFASISGGTNTGGLPVVAKVVCTTNTVTITVRNDAASTNALNGTLILDLVVFKA